MPLETALCLTCRHQPKVGLTVTRRDGLTAPAVLAKNAGKEVPQWYRRAGIYGALPPIVGAMNPWKGQLHAGTLLPPTDKVVLPLSALQKLDAEVPTDRPVWFAMWAAQPRQFDKAPQEAEPSYGTFTNAGLARSDPRAQTLTLEFALPAPYSVDGTLYHPHVHFTRLLEDETWEMAAWSISAPPVLRRAEVAALLRSGKYLGINCLATKTAQHIPGTLHVPHTMPLSQIKGMLRQLHPNSPLILYCASPECPASHAVFHKLLHLGYVNLLLYPGGLEDWHRPSSTPRNAPMAAPGPGPDLGIASSAGGDSPRRTNPARAQQQRAAAQRRARAGCSRDGTTPDRSSDDVGGAPVPWPTPR